jgi:hypothetical protein
LQRQLLGAVEPAPDSEFSGQSAQAFHAAPGSEVSTPARMEIQLYHCCGKILMYRAVTG